MLVYNIENLIPPAGDNNSGARQYQARKSEWRVASAICLSHSKKVIVAHYSFLKSTVMLKADIGFNAGNILALLSQKGKLSLREIGEETHYRDTAISLAIGWLLRENKVQVYENNGKLYFELNNCLSEIYYS